MHTEHKTLKWCLIVLAAIIAVGVCAFTGMQGVKGADKAEPVMAMPAEAAELTSEYAVEDLQKEPVKTDETAAKEEPEETQGAFVNVTVNVDGNSMDLLSASVTVGEMLEAYGIQVGKDDIVTPAVNKVMTEDTTVKVERITFEEIVVSEEIPFETKVEGTDELPAGTKKVVQKGKKGEDKVTYRVKYSDGKQVSRKEIARETVKKPVNKIIKKSTVGTINGAEYSRKFTVKAYSYTGGGTTASGLPAAVGRIAVDPSVIPLGTRVYVEGYGFATAADTGGNINGNTIDVYYNSESQCRQWGCRYITIYILK